jgi:hypothetical protein
MKLKLTKIAGHHVFVLPADLIAKSGWKHGDIFQASVEGDALRLARTQDVHDPVMEIAEQVMEEYRETFEALAKS